MRVYYQKRINYIEPNDDDVGEVPDDFKCWHIVRIIETDKEIYEDVDTQNILDDAEGKREKLFTRPEADKKVIQLNSTVDDSKLPLTQPEKLQEDYKYRKELELEIQRLQQRLKTLNLWIKHKESKYLNLPPPPPNIAPK